MNELKSRAAMTATTAEFLATFFFVLIGVGATAVVLDINGRVDTGGVVAIALAHGLAITAGILMFGRISGGHINPAVTIAVVFSGRMSLIRGVMYVAAQIAGAALAVLAVDSLTFPSDRLGVNEIPPRVGATNAFSIEVILTFLLVFAVFAVMLDKRAQAALGGVVVGVVMLLGQLVAIPVTGTSMNPARSFGPALVHGIWDNHWVFWAGPIVGALLAVVVYVLVFGLPADRDQLGTIRLQEPPE